jgi:hypothetical protein
MNWRITALASMAIVVACGDSTGSSGGGGGGGNSTSFTGIVTSDDGLASGALDFTIPSTSLLRRPPTALSLRPSFTVTGTLSYDGGAAVALTGTYDNTSDVLALTGGGFTLDGGFDGTDRIEGLVSGTASGTFVSASGATATAYCGNYAVTSGGGDVGTFSFVIAGSVVRGNAVSSVDQTLNALDGTFVGGTINIFDPGTTTVLATGTLSGTNVSGTFDDLAGTSGTWSGTVCP